MTGTDFCVNKPHMSRSYLNHLVQTSYSQIEQNAEFEYLDCQNADNDISKHRRYK